MSQETYIVLTVSGDDAVSFDPLGGLEVTRSGGATSGAPAEVRVETPQLSPREARDLRRDPRVRAAARPIPLRPIRPVALGEAEAAPTAAGGATWGVQATGAAQSRFTGAGVTVAVIDSGIDAAHPAFQGVELVQRDFSGEGGGDAGGHGTHVAGTIFGRTVGGVRFGVAPGVRRAVIGKVFGEQGGGSTRELVEAVQWAVAQGAQIINLSLGFDFPGQAARLINEFGLPPDLATSQALAGYRDNVRLFDQLAALLLAQGRMGFGALIVAASGNESRRDLSPHYTIDAGPPAAADHVVPVAAVGPQDGSPTSLSVAFFSNVGADLAAPGVDVLSAAPGGGFAVASGTSMAAPHVAGVAALWAERQIERTGAVDVEQLARLLIGNASLDRLAGASADDVGAGLASAPLG